jgi:hypothetical protein
MAPALRDGDLVTVAPVRAEDVRAGDILLYAAARGLTAHRVLGRLPGERPAFRTRGDAPGSPEEEVEASRVLGRVEALRRNGRERRVSLRARHWPRITRRLRGAARTIAARLCRASRVLYNVGSGGSLNIDEGHTSEPAER